MSLTKEQAIELCNSKWWEGKSAREIVGFQLFEEKLCMPFGDFHGAVETALGRPVYSHEFGMNVEGLKKEFLGTGAPPTLAEICEMIPEAKRVIAVV